MPWSFCRGRRHFRLRPQRPYELNDEFQVPDPNPLANPRICEPGPGALHGHDMDARMSVNFGALTFAGASAAWDRTYLFSGGQTWSRRAGRYLEAEFTPLNIGYMRVGWQQSQTGLISGNLAMIYFSGSGNIEVVDDLDVMQCSYPYAAGVASYRFRVVDTGDGFLYYVQTAPATGWTVVWHKPLSRSRLDTLWLAIQNIDLTGTMQWLRVGSAPLRPPSLVRQPAHNEIICGSADCLVDATLTGIASGAPGLVYRYSDAANYWRAIFDISAGQIKLIKKVAGVDTTVASAAFSYPGTWTKLRVVCFGNYHRVFVAQTRLLAATDAFNSTAEGVGTLADVTYKDLRCHTSGPLPN
jgi:hypothetical protein